MDIDDTIAPKVDQLTAEDLLGGARQPVRPSRDRHGPCDD